MHCFALIPLLAFVSMGVNAATIHHDRHTPMPIAHTKAMREVHNADFSKQLVSPSRSLPGGSEASENHSGHKRALPSVSVTDDATIDDEEAKGIKLLANPAPVPSLNLATLKLDESLNPRADDEVDANGATPATPSDTVENVANKINDVSASPPANSNSTSGIVSPRGVHVNTPVKAPRNIKFTEGPVFTKPGITVSHPNSAVLGAHQVPSAPGRPVPSPAVPAPAPVGHP